MAIAFVALLAALSGTAVALPGKNTVDSGDIKNGVVKSDDIKNGGVASKDVKNGGVASKDIKNGGVATDDLKNNDVRSGDVRDNTLTGTDINESTLGQVPSANTANSASSANTAQTLQGKSPADFASSSTFRTFFEYLEAGQTRTLATNGPLTLFAVCTSEGGTDTIDIQVVSTVGGAFSAGSGPLTVATPTSVLTNSVATDTADYTNDIDEDSQIAPDGSYFGIDGETVGLGLNIFGHRCVTAGAITVLQKTP